MMKRPTILLTAAIAAGAFAAGCSKQESAQSAPPELPAAVFLAGAPDGAVGVADAKESARAGETVTLRGRIGGTARPFTDGRAVFTIVDLALPSCADNPADTCSTPWDYCCESSADIAAHSATIQFVDADGAPLRARAEGVRGLAPLTEVLVVGKVAETDNRTTLVVNAESVYVAPAGS